MLVLTIPGVLGRYRVECVAFGPEGRTLAAAYGPTGLLVWDDVSPGVPARLLTTRTGALLCGPVEFAADGRTILCHSYSGPLIWSIAGGEPTSVPAEGNGYYCRAAFGPEDTLVIADLAVSGTPGLESISRRPFTDPRPGNAAWSVSAYTWARCQPVVAADGAEVVTLERRKGGADQPAETFLVSRDVASGREVRSTKLGLDDPKCEPMLAVGQGLIVARKLNTLTAWKVPDRPAGRVQNDGKKHFTGIAFHPSGRFLAATSNDATVKLYDTATWAVARTFTWNIGRMRSVAFSPDGTLAAAGSDTGKVVVWDVDA